MIGYKTVAERAEAEIIEKKSRFIAHICPVQTEEAALSFLGEVRAAHRMARHNVYAYVLRSGRVRYSDDGEPQRTAGLPTLETIQHQGLEDVAVVVTRYFGGTLLGTGGLVRAYTQAAQAVIEAAPVVVMTRCRDLTVVISYSHYELVRHLIEQWATSVNPVQARVIDTTFTSEVTVVVRIPDGMEQSLIGLLTNATNSRCTITKGDAHEVPL